MNKNRHPVTLLTGFLGSGKTTFLNTVMAYKENTRFAIIENEIGEADIDGNMVMQSDNNLMEVNNGCICCSLNDNFFAILKNLHERKDEWDELIIEATGIADPAGVAAPFFNQPVIKNNFHLERIICLADAGQIEEQLRRAEIAAKQIAYSDVIMNSVSVEAGAPWKDGEDQKSRIVLIGKGLKAKGHERMLRKGLRKAKLKITFP